MAFWRCSVIVAHFVTVRLSSEGDDKTNKFKNRKAQIKRCKLWRRTDKLAKGWSFGSVGTDVLHQLWRKDTRRDVWLRLLDNFEEEEKDDETGEVYRRYLPLYQAIIRDQQAARNFFPDINNFRTTIISSHLETVLHVTVLKGKSNNLVNKSVDIMRREVLHPKDSKGKIALHYNAFVGNTTTPALVNRNPNLLDILSDDNRLSVHTTTMNCHKKTLHCFIAEPETNFRHDPFKYESQQGVIFLNEIIASTYVDIAAYLAHKFPNLTQRVDDDGDSALSIIAQTSTLFPRTDAFTWWQKFFYHLPNAKEMREKKSMRAQVLQLAKHLCYQIATSLHENEALKIFEKSIHLAAIYGISELVEMIDKYHLAIYYRDSDTDKDVFSLAMAYRFENDIYVVYNMNECRYMFCSSTYHHDNNLLHICVKLAPYRLNLVAGLAPQLQCKSQGLKETEYFVLASRRTWPNHEKQTPHMLFTKEHEKLKEAGEKWMKDTANACTIVATLIATIMFAAALTIPGEIEPASGKSLLSSKPSFMLFGVSNVISLFTSITSLLLFLSILTSRYNKEDFLYVLPKRLSLGLLSLFVSITFMLVAFSATLYLVLPRQRDVHDLWRFSRPSLTSSMHHSCCYNSHSL